MINYLHLIRKRLLDENKFSKYLIYASGEVILIVIGIFLGLQLQNANEKRKQEANFKILLERIYNELHNDTEVINDQQQRLNHQLQLLSALLYNPDSVHLEELPYLLHGMGFEDLGTTYSEVVDLAGYLAYNPENMEQNELATQVKKYAMLYTNQQDYSETFMDELFDELEFKVPQFVGNTAMNGVDRHNRSYYSPEELQQFQTFRNSYKYRVKLESLKAKKAINNTIALIRGLQARSLIRQIETYHRKVRLIYTDVGIIGSAIDGWDNEGASSRKMTLTDEDSDIWEITLPLKVGEVKFRCRDSWTQSWGGDTFPNGRAYELNSPNITVNRAGTYKIILNLQERTYNFIELEEGNTKG